MLIVLHVPDFNMFIIGSHISIEKGHFHCTAFLLVGNPKESIF
jgi:hypothetical protein